MTPEKLRELAEIISKLEQIYKQQYRGVSGGFAIGKYLFTENGTIFITMLYGVQSDCTNRTRDDLVFLDEKTLECTDAEGVIIKYNQPESPPVLRIVSG